MKLFSCNRLCALYCTLIALQSVLVTAKGISQQADSGLRKDPICADVLLLTPISKVAGLGDTEHDPALERELVSYLQTPVEDQSIVYRQAHSLLTSLENSPSCNRLATVHLLSSCHSLSNGKITQARALKSPTDELDLLKSLYAARLAVCELTGARVTTPDQCLSLLPSVRTNKSQRSKWLRLFNQRGKNSEDQKVDEVYKNALEECLQALESRPQWWTSYSNGKQNAEIMCQAARGEIEKEELLSLHRSMVFVASDISSAMESSLRQSNMEAQNHKDFVMAVRIQSSRILKDLREAGGEIKISTKAVLQSLTSMAQDTIAAIVGHGERVNRDMESLRTNVAESKDDIRDLRKNVRKVFSDVLFGSSKLAANQVEHFEHSKEAALQLREVLNDIKESNLNELVEIVGFMHNQMVVSNQLILKLHDRQSVLETRLLGIGSTFNHLEAQANGLSKVQALQSQSQLRLHESLNVDMHIAHDLMAKVTESATNLKMTVDDTSNLVQTMGITSGMLRQLSHWLGLGLVTIGICLVRGRLAGYVAIGIGSTFMLEIWSKADNMIQHVCSNAPFEECLKNVKIPSSIFTFPAAIVVFLGIIWYCRNPQNTLNRPSLLLELPTFRSIKAIAFREQN